MEARKLTLKGKFPNYDVLRIGEYDLKNDLSVSQFDLSMSASDIPRATITAYVTEGDIEIYVNADITLEARYNGKIYRLVEVATTPEGQK